MSCKSNAQCDFCDARCADWYEETEEYIATINQIHMPDGTYKYCKLIYYKVPKYGSNGKQIIYEILIPDGEVGK